MIDDGRVAVVPVLFSAILLLTACVTTRNDDNAGFSKGDQYLHYGVEAFAAGQPALAKSRFNWALGIFERNGNLDGQIRAHINLAEQAFLVRDISGAAAHINRAEKLAVQSGETPYQRRIQLIQSSIALHQGDYYNARILLAGVLGNTGEQNGHQTTDAIYVTALINRAILSLQQDDGEFAQWVDRLKHSLDPSQKAKPSVYGRLLRFEAELHRRKGEFSKAEDSFNKAMLLYESGPFDLESGATLSEWAQLDIEQGQWVSASDRLRRSILLMDAVGNQEGVIDGLEDLVIVESERGRPAEADVLRELVLVLRNNQAPHGNRVREVIGVRPD
jgi:tetratricopeptide (TPR) repeat protein